MAGNKETAYASYQHALDVYPNSVRARLEYADLLIKDKNNFSINEHKTILYGLCNTCSQ